MADKAVKKTRNAKSDLNRADRDELVSVPGIGPRWRRVHPKAARRSRRLQESG
jgi:predicted DNA-binding helix-hairpin-helix protein